MPFTLVTDAITTTKSAGRPPVPVGTLGNVTVAGKHAAELREIGAGNARTHSYDATVMAARDQRKFTDAVFLAVQAGDLKTTANCISVIKGMLLQHDIMKQYLPANAMPAPMDNPGLNRVTRAIFVRRAHIEGNNIPHPSIPDEIEGIVPLLGPLQLSLNSQSTLVAHHWSFFTGMYTAATGKTLAKSPSPYAMDLLISCAARAWT
ncbi:hypothetical protein GGF31_000703 [Allomyces arbusculus]|nr:hypothetical protein GGF31_000703 [Allomyces arbusculus]